MDFLDSEDFIFQKTDKLAYVVFKNSKNKNHRLPSLVLLHGQMAGYLEDQELFLKKVSPFVGRIILPFGWHTDEQAESKRRRSLSNIVNSLTFLEPVSLVANLGPDFKVENFPVIDSKCQKWFEGSIKDEAIQKTFKYLEEVISDTEIIMKDEQSPKILPIIGGFFEGGSMAIEIMLRYAGKFSKCFAVNPTFNEIVDLNRKDLETHGTPFFLMANLEEPPSMVEGVRLLALGLSELKFNVKFEKSSLGIGNLYSENLKNFLSESF